MKITADRPRSSEANVSAGMYGTWSSFTSACSRDWLRPRSITMRAGGIRGGERSPTGRARLLSIAERLKSDATLHHDAMLSVAMEGSPADSELLSSIGRELEAVRSHTVHHFALISVLLRYYGLPVPSDFGVSQATLLYRAESAAHQAA